MGRWSEVDIRADMGFNTFKSAMKRFPFFSLLLPWYDSGIGVGWEKGEQQNFIFLLFH